ncbi:MAG TPA: hypothetical protein V6C76_08905 [Drouetiella sp.]
MMMMTGKTIAVAALSLIVGCVTLYPAFAAPSSGMDVFSNITPGNNKEQKKPLSAAAQKVQSMLPPANPVGQGSMAMMSGASPAVSWFEKFDATTYSLLPTDADRIVLKTPFNQEAERVISWTKTAAKVAHNYRLLAKTLKSSSVPTDCPALKQFQDLTADWYNDKAAVYEDMIRPRTPAKTIEELNDQLKDVSDRATSIAQVQKDLHAMDMHLRDVYHVHNARETDKLYQYVSGQKPTIH